MARFVPPITQLGNDNFSGPGSGWKLNFYVSGAGFVRKDTFSDDALTVANLNPVVADSAGRFGNIFLESGTYKVVLTDENDVQKWSADPVEGAAGAAGAVGTVILTNHTITVDELGTVLPVDATAGPITMTLPAVNAVGNGSEVEIKKIDATANAVTVDGNAAETIDGATTIALPHQYSSIKVRSDGTTWFVLPRTQEILGAFALQGVASPAQITADQNDYNPAGLATAAVLRLDSNATRRITGLAGGNDGRVLTIHNIGTGGIVLPSEDVLSLAANRFSLAHNIGLGASATATLRYDGTTNRWREFVRPRPDHGQCRLTKSGANLLLSPYDGNGLIIDGASHAVPSAGVTLAATGLTIDTDHFIYAFNDGTGIVLEASTTGHSTDATTGVEIQTGDPSRTLVGMGRPITGPAWQDTGEQRFVISYFTRRNIFGFSNFAANRTSTSTANPPTIEINSEIRNEFLTWADELVGAKASGAVESSTANNVFTAFDYDGGGAVDPVMTTRPASGQPLSTTLEDINDALSEGFHFVTLKGATGSGTATWRGSASVATNFRWTLSTVIRG